MKSLFETGEPQREVHGHERRHLHLACASLLHEATRVDLATHATEREVAERSLAALFGLAREQAVREFREGSERATRLTSYFGPVAIIKRDLTPAERARFVGELWHVAYADGKLDPYEDHYVRKIGHLLHVPNTEIMLARNRARSAASRAADR